MLASALVRCPRASGRVLLCALALAATAPRAAQAVPVAFTAGGDLGNALGGGDPIQLNGATVRITLFADTDDAPTSTTSDATSIRAHYQPSSGTLEFTNRPGGAADLSIPYTPELVTVNTFEPSATPDGFEILDSSTTGVPGSSRFYVGGFRVSFINASIYPGTEPGPLPGFDITGGAVVYGVFYDLGRSALYADASTFGDPYASVAVVPEPATAPLIGLGLAGLAFCGGRRPR